MATWGLRGRLAGGNGLGFRRRAINWTSTRGGSPWVTTWTTGASPRDGGWGRKQARRGPDTWACPGPAGLNACQWDSYLRASYETWKGGFNAPPLHWRRAGANPREPSGASTSGTTLSSPSATSHLQCEARQPGPSLGVTPLGSSHRLRQRQVITARTMPGCCCGGFPHLSPV